MDTAVWNEQLHAVLSVQGMPFNPDQSIGGHKQGKRFAKGICPPKKLIFQRIRWVCDHNIGFDGRREEVHLGEPTTANPWR